MSPETLRRFFRLNARARGIVLDAAAALSITRAGLRLFGFRNWQRILEWFSPAPAPSKDAGRLNLALAHRVARLQGSAERHLFFRASCLEHSLVLQWMLRRFGISAQLQIGGRKQSDRFEAHAWVEVNGLALAEPNSVRADFVPFTSALGPMETRLR